MAAGWLPSEASLTVGLRRRELMGDPRPKPVPSRPTGKSPMRRRAIPACATVAAILSCWSVAPAAVCAEEFGVEFFEAKIRPVLVEHCYECHSAGSETVEGG